MAGQLRQSPRSRHPPIGGGEAVGLIRHPREIAAYAAPLSLL